MTREERRQLVEAPLPVSRRIPGKSWAGVLISDKVPTEGRRQYSPSPEDEEIGRMLAQESWNVE